MEKHMSKRFPHLSASQKTIPVKSITQNITAYLAARIHNMRKVDMDEVTDADIEASQQAMRMFNAPSFGNGEQRGNF